MCSLSTPTSATKMTMANSDQIRQATTAVTCAASDWYESKRDRASHVNMNVMSVGLLLAEYMADGLPLQEPTYLASSQVRGLSGSRIRSILAAHGENRTFTSEGGRTSRKSAPLAKELASILNSAALGAGLADLSDSERGDVSHGLQCWFVERVQEDFFGRQRVSAEIDPNRPARVAVANLLASAAERTGNDAGAVAQHLVGAKLALRFRGVEVSNHRYTTADKHTDRPGDFTVGDTAIHVTTAPTEALVRKCGANLVQGFRVLMLVPASLVEGARQLADVQDLADRISIQAIEDFVGTNVEEMGGLVAADIRVGVRALLEMYNERVSQVEPDPSLQIDVPSNL